MNRYTTINLFFCLIKSKHHIFFSGRGILLWIYTGYPIARFDDEKPLSPQMLDSTGLINDQKKVGKNNSQTQWDAFF